MSKRSKSKKPAEWLDEMPIVKAAPGVKTKKFDAADELRDPDLVAVAFFEALQEGDIDGALEIIEGFVMASDKVELARRTGLAPSTIYNTFSEGSNPTLKTLSRLLKAAA